MCECLDRIWVQCYDRYTYNHKEHEELIGLYTLIYIFVFISGMNAQLFVEIFQQNICI